MTINTNTASTHYANTPFGEGGLKGWLKAAGDKPTDQHFSVAHAFAKRPGKQTMAHALALRDGGVSGSDIMLVCGAQQLNHMRGLIEAKWFSRDMNAPRNAKGQAVYKLNLTPKGEAELAKRQAKATEAAAAGEVTNGKAKVKAKGKGKGGATKPRKPKVKAPVEPEAPPAPVTTEAPQAEAPVTA